MQLLIGLLISIAFGYQAKQKGRDGLKFGAGVATALLVPLAAIQFWDQAVGAHPALWWVIAAFVTYMAWARLKNGPRGTVSKWDTMSRPDSQSSAESPSEPATKKNAAKFSRYEKIGVAFFSVLLLVGVVYGPRSKQQAIGPAVSEEDASAKPFKILGSWRCRHSKKADPQYFFRTYYFGADGVMATLGDGGSDHTVHLSGIYALKGAELRRIEAVSKVTSTSQGLISNWALIAPGGRDFLLSNFRDWNYRIEHADGDSMTLRTLRVSNGQVDGVLGLNPSDDVQCERTPDLSAESVWRDVPRTLVAQVKARFPEMSAASMTNAQGVSEVKSAKNKPESSPIPNLRDVEDVKSLTDEQVSRALAREFDFAKSAFRQVEELRDSLAQRSDLFCRRYAAAINEQLGWAASIIPSLKREPSERGQLVYLIRIKSYEKQARDLVPRECLQ